ncbi:general transcription factor IIH subunit 5 isoform X1 [Pteropus alecto]|nr:general transcription factor IIH subunit 5 isoform X1 [Pteropus alecto]XP_024904839.1 general transcription factor IIH subunit 5 isoform X1 [Pteropus alecto]XP_039729833.1 general transcription factor IIH subunit 5 isoform X1 [Pteropus giganteus]XP_039729834.1 general transcription factor IIH subunit 5 isoform X1 [Pteropus giganteus]
MEPRSESHTIRLNHVLCSNPQTPKSFLGFSLKTTCHSSVALLSDSCDPAMKQFLLYLDESNALGKKFIIQDIDDTHVFVIAELVNVLQERVGELMDQNAFSLTQK